MYEPCCAAQRSIAPCSGLSAANIKASTTDNVPTACRAVSLWLQAVLAAAKGRPQLRTASTAVGAATDRHWRA